MSLPAGTRVRLKGVPWPERVGSEGVIVVAPNGPGVYPDDPRDKTSVIVRLDDDPLGARQDGWTCVVLRRDVEIIA